MKVNDLMEAVKRKIEMEINEKAKRKIEKEIIFISQKEKHIEYEELCIKTKIDEVTKLKEAVFKMKAEMDKVFELPLEEYIIYDFNKISSIWHDVKFDFNKFNKYEEEEEEDYFENLSKKLVKKKEKMNAEIIE